MESRGHPAKGHRATIHSALHGGLDWQPLIVEPSSYGEVVCADVNDAWYPPASAVLDTLIAWHRTVNHSPDSLCRALTSALSQYLAIDPDLVEVGNGSSELLHAAISCLVEPGGEAVVQDPTYGEYARSVAAAGGRITRAPLRPEDGFATHSDFVLDRITPATQLVVLCNPNNPTGHVVERTEILRLVASVPDRVFVLIDEAYIDYDLDASVVGDIQRYPNLVVVRTFSKAYAMAGLRVGYAAFGRSARKRFRFCVRPPWPVPTLSMAAAKTALQNYAYVKQQIARTLVLKDELQRQLNGIDGLRLVSSRTHYFMLDLLNLAVSSHSVVKALRSDGVFIRDCRDFGGSIRDRYVRITVQDERQNKCISRALHFALAQLRRAASGETVSRG